MPASDETPAPLSTTRPTRENERPSGFNAVGLCTRAPSPAFRTGQIDLPKYDIGVIGA